MAEGTRFCPRSRVLGPQSQAAFRQPAFLLLRLPPVPVFALQGYQEQGILFGYRPPRSSAADCLLSVFQMTNETLNIWTHFVPAW